MTGARMTGRRKIVIGDSLAGLTVALAPRHAGFEVDDFERSARKSAAGAPASRWLPIGRRRYRRHQHKEQRPVGAVPDKYEPFDREDFAIIFIPSVRRRPRIECTRPAVGQIGS